MKTPGCACVLLLALGVSSGASAPEVQVTEQEVVKPDRPNFAPKVRALSPRLLNSAPSSRAASYSKYLQCYEGIGFKGDSVLLREYAESLEKYDFDDRAKSCCAQGIWILYDFEDYNQGRPEGSSVWIWGEDYCDDLRTDSGFFYANRASSARYAGAPDGYWYPVLNIYQSEGFSGIEHFYYNDAIQLDHINFGESIIVAGCEPWTIYTRKNYEGYSVCFYPADTEYCYPGFYSLRKHLEGLDDNMGSARRGCYSSYIASPRSLEDNAGNLRASGRLLKASVRDKMEGKEEEKEPTKFVGGGGGSYVPAEAEEDKEFEEMLDIHPQ